MYINKEILNDFEIQFPLEKYAPLDQILFLDIGQICWNKKPEKLVDPNQEKLMISL